MVDFVFKKCRRASLQVTKVSFPIPLFYLLFLIRFSPPSPCLTVTTRFLGLGGDKVC